MMGFAPYRGLCAAGLLAGMIPAGLNAGTMPLPEGCTAFLTVQQKQCLVTHHYTCKNDPEGHQWRVDINEGGMSFAAKTDAEAQWLYSVEIFSGREETLVEGAKDPSSMTELLADKLDTWDFETTTPDGEVTRFHGYDQITGEATIDEVDLLTSYARIASTDGKGTINWHAEGTQYVSPKWRLFFFGTDTYTDGDGSTVETDHTPIDFIFPGEPGFLADAPAYECNVMNTGGSAAPQSPDQMEGSDDQI
ncbi:MAG: hypothetical protein ACWA40_08110 [Planktomarina sp.]